MTTQLIFCGTCDKATYLSGRRYHREHCSYIARGYDCYCLEDENLFCNCEVK